MSRRLLVSNVYYAPQSFGGATIVAEELNARLSRFHGWDILVVSSHHDPAFPYYSMIRMAHKGVDVISVNIPQELSPREQYHNTAFDLVMEDIIEAFQPDIAHIHSTQMLGCGYFSLLDKKNIPFMVSLHDCWWLCDRQFMINGNGHYCWQKRIDSNICNYCVNSVDDYQIKVPFARQQLALAEKLLAPSDFQRDLYLHNDFSPEACIINKNGINFPRPEYKKQARKHADVVFGFVGGPGAIKGAPLLLEAFRSMPDKTNYQLAIVDAAKNAGTSWKNTLAWEVPGQSEFVPPYDQASMDEFYGSIDVLLFPSQWKESFGLTVREALARDVWVICTDSGGVVEDVVDGENGTIIPMSGQVDELARAITDCLKRTDWAQYKNPHSNILRSFDQQAAELNDVLLAALQ